MAVIGRQPSPAPMTAADAASAVIPSVVSDKANSSTGFFDLPAGTTAQRPASPTAGATRFNTDTGKPEVYTGTYWGPLDISWGTYTASVVTPNGGTQTCRYLFDTHGLWVLVGRFAASAKDGIQGIWGSTRGLDVSTGQAVATAFSADWGDYQPSRVRILGSTNFDLWRDNRTIDWMYGVPSGRTWRYFFSGGVSSGMASGGDNWGNGTRSGFGCAGVYDGFGRWSNPGYSFMRVSDGNTTHSTDAFVTPTANAFNWNTTGDAKLGCHATAASSGQDCEDHAEFGSDDDFDIFYDTYPTVTGASTYPVNFSSAVWILLKVG